MPEQMITVDFSSLDPSDSADLFRTLTKELPYMNMKPGFPDEHVYEHRSIDCGLPEIMTFVLSVTSTAGAASAAEIVKAWFGRRPNCQHESVTIYGSDGTAIKIVKCDAGPR